MPTRGDVHTHLASVQGHWAKDCPNQTAGAGVGSSPYGGGYGGDSYGGRKDYGGRGGGGYGGGSYGGGGSQGETALIRSAAVCLMQSTHSWGRVQDKAPCVRHVH